MEHVLIFAKDIEETKRFYENILGMKVGYRPPFKFPGYWIYLDSIPVLGLFIGLDGMLELINTLFLFMELHFKYLPSYDACPWWLNNIDHTIAYSSS